MMPKAWAFRRGQARLVVPTWSCVVSDNALEGFLATATMEEGGGRAKFGFSISWYNFFESYEHRDKSGESRNTLAILAKRSTNRVRGGFTDY